MLENFEKSNPLNYKQEHEVSLSIINEMEEDDFMRQQLEADAGVWEGYTIKEHTLMAMTQFEKYFSKEQLPLNFKTDSFRKILSVHDIGKPKALAEKEKEKQHEYTKMYAPEILTKQGLTDEEIKIAQALFTGDPIGNYIKGSRNLSKSAKEIVEMAESAEVEASDFFELLIIFYQVDASAYTKDASIKDVVQGKKSLDYLFDFDNQKHEIDFSLDTKTKIDVLREFLLKTRTEDESNNTEIVKIIISVECPIYDRYHLVPKKNKEYPMDIEFRKKIFEYPPDIQKETGFVGYERKIVDWGNIITIYKKMLKDQGVDIENIELEELLSLNRFIGDMKEEDETPNIEIKQKVQAKLFSDLWHVLGDKSFPNLTFNHSIGGYKIIKNYEKQFVSDRIFLQKIYHPSVWAQMAKKGIYIGRGQDTAEFELRDEKNNQVKELHLDIDGEALNLSKNLDNIVFDKNYFQNHGQSKRLDKFRSTGAYSISTSMYADYVEGIYKHIVNNNQYLITKSGFSGLSVGTGLKKWLPKRGLFSDSVFGFDIRSKPFKDYIAKVSELEKVLGTSESTIDKSKVMGSYGTNTDKFVALQGMGEINEETLSEWWKQHGKGNEHPFIPIVINHKDIPELRWGHAKYASIPTKKGLNVIKMRYKE